MAEINRYFRVNRIKFPKYTESLQSMSMVSNDEIKMTTLFEHCHKSRTMEYITLRLTAANSTIFFIKFVFKLNY